MIQPHADPFTHFKIWFDHASVLPNIQYPDAMTLSTVGEEGYPNSRIILLKSYSDAGFVFYTNKESTKGQELARNAKAALLFFWDSLRLQVRIQGEVVPVSHTEADAYFLTRHRVSQIGAIASAQSRRLESPELLRKAVEKLEAQYEGYLSIPRPPQWGGYRVVPSEVEFWQERDYRLHDRLVYRRTEDGWETFYRYP